MDRQIQFQFFTSGGQLLTYWIILRSFPEWCFYVSVKSRFLEASLVRQADGKLKKRNNFRKHKAEFAKISLKPETFM